VVKIPVSTIWKDSKNYGVSMQQSVSMQHAEASSELTQIELGQRSQKNRGRSLKLGQFLGRAVSWIRMGSKSFSKILSDVDATCHLMRLSVHVMAATRLIGCGAVPGSCDNVAESVGRSVTYLDASRGFAGANYALSGVASKDFRRGAQMKVAGVTLLTIADAFSGLFFLAECGLKAASRAVSAMGRTRVLQAVGCSTQKLAGGLAVGGLTLLALDVARDIGQGQLLKADNSKRWIKLASLVSSTAQAILLTAGLGNPATILALGLLSSALALTSFLYDAFHTSEAPKQGMHTVHCLAT
jgi:hypothetical protein